MEGVVRKENGAQQSLRTKTRGGRLGFHCEKEGCQRAFPSMDLLRLHTANHQKRDEDAAEKKKAKAVVARKKYNNAAPYTCVFCEKIFKTAGMLDNHLHTHLDERPHDCSVCGRSYKFVKKMNEHKKRVHQKIGLNHSCPNCPLKFYTPSNLKRHLRTHLDPQAQPKFKCRQCDHVYSDESTLATHLKTHHNTEKPLHQCSFCFRTFSSEEKLQQHKKEAPHHKEKQFNCALCDKMYGSRKTLRIHLKTRFHLIKEEEYKIMASPLIFRCQSCNSTFPSQQLLAEHVNNVHIRPQERLFRCEVEGCTKAYMKKEVLKLHVNANHLNIRNFSCSRCGTTFKTKFVLDQHNNRKRSCQSPSVQCPSCSSTFPNDTQLFQHVKVVHSTYNQDMEDSLTCGMCPEMPKFSSKKKLYDHRLSTHMDQILSDYSYCLFCSKRLSCVQTMYDHLLTHTREKPFECPTCNRLFASQGGVRKHLINHRTDSPYKCDFHGLSYKSMAQLRRHIGTVHRREKNAKHQSLMISDPNPSA